MATVEQQEAYLNQLKSEMQMQMMQDLMNRITEGCFKKCTGKSGEHLDIKEKTCLSNCMGRYMETMNVVSSSIRNRGSN